MTVFRKNLIRGLFSAAGVALLGACSSTPTPNVDYKSDYNFAAVKTVAFYQNSGAVSGSNPLSISDMQRDRINVALRSNIENKGLQFTDDASKADLLLSWHLATAEKTDVRTYETPNMMPMHPGYYGYNRYSMYNCWSCGSNTEISVQNYTEGSFIVDMIDPEMKKSVWRSSTQSRLKKDRKEADRDYQGAANLVLEGFPPQ